MHTRIASLLAAFAAAFAFALPVVAAVPTTGLVARYDFNGNANDSVAARNGVVSGATLTSNRFGNGSSAYSFNGTSAYIQIADASVFSVAATGQFSISVWIRPGTLTFPSTEGTGYVHWLGKGTSGQHEWTFRMYSADNTEGRENRISFYAFNLSGGLGAGSYVQEPVTALQWIHIVALVDVATDTIKLYKNGVLKDTDTLSSYSIVPQNGTAPVRIGTRDFASYFKGAIDNLYFYNRLLTETEIQSLHTDTTK